MSLKKRSLKKPLIILFITVLVDLIGFGMIIPILPFLARSLEASSYEVGLLLTFYAGFQFLFAPVWGIVSDRIGRKPVIMIGLLGTGVAHFLFSYSTHLITLILVRILAGSFAATISTAMAVVGDITKKSNRSRGMGIVGAAFGLGFIIGPLVGAVFSMFGKFLGSHPPFGEHFVAFMAGVMALLNFVFVYFYFEESLLIKKKEVKTYASLKPHSLSSTLTRLIHLRQWQVFKNMPSLQFSLAFIFFLYSLSISQLETCLFLFLDDVFDWNSRQASLGFAYMGFLMLITQTYFLNQLIPLVGESRLLGIGIVLGFFGYLTMTLTKNIFELGVAVTLVGIGSALIQVILRGSVSILSPKEAQGTTMGALHSLGALSRVIGPLVAGLLYEIEYFLPFLISAGLLLVGLLKYLLIKNHIPIPGYKAKAKLKSEEKI